MITRNHIALFIMLAPLISKGQHTRQTTTVLWAAYNNVVRLNKKWALVNDAQLRTKDWAGKWLLYGVRSGVSYDVTRNLTVAGGGTFFRSAQYSGSDYFFKNEWRPWEEMAYKVKMKRSLLLQRLRAEQRFLQQVVNNEKSPDYKYIFRLRYRFEWQFLLATEALALSLGNEIFVNPGNPGNSVFFDQNRSFAGIHFKVSNVTTLQGQFMKIYQWHSSTSVLEDQNVLRINIYQQLNTGKKNGSKQ